MRVCRSRRVPVAIHATTPEAVQVAVKAGAHSIEHGYVLDEEAVALMAEKGTYLVPTLAISHMTPKQAASEHDVTYSSRHC